MVDAVGKYPKRGYSGFRHGMVPGNEGTSVTSSANRFSAKIRKSAALAQSLV
jgi:hypothetical protein